MARRGPGWSTAPSGPRRHALETEDIKVCGFRALVKNLFAGARSYERLQPPREGLSRPLTSGRLLWQSHVYWSRDCAKARRQPIRRPPGRNRNLRLKQLLQRIIRRHVGAGNPDHVLQADKPPSQKSGLFRVCPAPTALDFPEASLTAGNSNFVQSATSV